VQEILSSNKFLAGSEMAEGALIPSKEDYAICCDSGKFLYACLASLSPQSGFSIEVPVEVRQYETLFDGHVKYSSYFSRECRVAHMDASENAHRKVSKKANWEMDRWVMESLGEKVMNAFCAACDRERETISFVGDFVCMTIGYAIDSRAMFLGRYVPGEVIIDAVRHGLLPFAWDWPNDQLLCFNPAVVKKGKMHVPEKW